MSQDMDIKSSNPKSTQNKTNSKIFGYSDSTIKRYGVEKDLAISCGRENTRERTRAPKNLQSLLIM